MLDFEYHNPVKLVFGRGKIAELKSLVPKGSKVLFLYGQGSIKENGVYDRVRDALSKNTVLEFAGIEPNPRYETLMQAVILCREKNIDFLLAVGGGSVVDGVKFVSLAVPFEGAEPWDILAKKAPVTEGLPFGCVLTLPATGSEMNGNLVISRAADKQKLAVFSQQAYPVFSILDPETTYSLPDRQVANGIVDAFVHVLEQYCTFDCKTPLQDRLAEAVLLTLVEEGPKALELKEDYDARANVMFCATNALNGWLACGTAQDWATHMIGHELTALYGVDHAQSLAVVLPALLRYKMESKKQKLAQLGRRVWQLEGHVDAVAQKTIDKIRGFFEGLGVKTSLSYYDITDPAGEVVGERIQKRGLQLGEHQDIGREEVKDILRMVR